MDVVTIRELSHSPGRLLERLKRGPVLVTRSGRPMAVLHPVDEEALADFVLANAPEYLRDMRQADREINRGARGRPLEDVLAELEAEENQP
jgi:prevent-host-death family protein